MIKKIPLSVAKQIQRYVELVKSGLHPTDAKKQAELEMNGVEIGEPDLEGYKEDNQS